MNDKLNKFYVSPIETEDDKKGAIKVVDFVFCNYGGYKTISASVDFDKSYALKKGYEIIGAYLLGKHSVFTSNDILKHYDDKEGLEGAALCIHPEYRGLGYGKMLKDYPSNNMDVDYIWGMQMSTLNNLENWLSKRRLVYNGGGMFVTLEDIKDTFPHTYQTSGINCGAGSLKIILMYYGLCDDISIDQLSKIMEIDHEFGTTGVRMKLGLDKMKLAYEQIKVDKLNAMDYLKNYLKNDRKVLLRTLINGIKHWVTLYDYKCNEFYISDPAFGKYKRNEKEIYKIWEPRDFDGFVVYGEKRNQYKINDIKEIY